MAHQSSHPMAESSIGIPEASVESELKELDKTPLNRTPLIRSPFRSTPQAAAPASKAGATVIDKTLSSAANLVKLLPSGTVLLFQSLLPSFTNSGACYVSNKYITSVLLNLCALSCIFFNFTDSIVGTDGKHYYGIATPRSFFVFNYDGPDENQSLVFGDALQKLRLRVLDYIHAFFSILVFLSLAFSDSNIQTCFFPHAGKDTKQLLVNLPLGAGFLSSLVFLIFPTARKGIGYTDLTPHNTAY